MLPSMRIVSGLVPLWGLCVVSLGLWSSGAAAKTYEDTKHRFALELAPGGELAPLPGDTGGMMFRKKTRGTPASLHITVREQETGETTKQTLDAAEAPFRTEIGYREGVDVPTSIGLLPAMRRAFTVYASGDAKTVRFVELQTLHAFGFVHVFHLDTLDTKKDLFTADVERMLASYRPLAGKEVAAPLTGTLWMPLASRWWSTAARTRSSM